MTTDRRPGMVGVSLMNSEETAAAVALLRASGDDKIRISDRDCYYKIEREGYLQFDMAAISEEVGRDTPPNMFLVNMSTFYGRILVSEDRIELFADALPEGLRPRSTLDE